MALYIFKDIENQMEDPTSEIPYSGKVEDYDFSRFDSNMFLRKMMQLGNREPKVKDDGKPAPLECTKQLYQVCRSNPLDTELKPGMTINDIYCCRENSDQYTERTAGPRLMELRYMDCTPESRFIEFKYPYNEDLAAEENFTVRIFVSNPNVYNILLHRTYNYDGPILVYANWMKISSILTGNVDGQGQVVSLSKDF